MRRSAERLQVWAAHLPVFGGSGPLTSPLTCHFHICFKSSIDRCSYNRSRLDHAKSLARKRPHRAPVTSKLTDWFYLVVFSPAATNTASNPHIYLNIVRYYLPLTKTIGRYYVDLTPTHKIPSNWHSSAWVTNHTNVPKYSMRKLHLLLEYPEKPHMENKGGFFGLLVHREEVEMRKREGENFVFGVWPLLKKRKPL